MQVVLDKGFVECLIQLKRSDDRKAVNVALTRFSKNPSNPGLNLERLRDVRDRNLWSMRVNRDVRVILCRGRETWLVLYVDHHDAAYRWAERVKVRRHSATGGLQIVHTEEVYKEEVFQHPSPQPDDGLLSPNIDEEYILSLGIPEEALPAAKGGRPSVDPVVFFKLQLVMLFEDIRSERRPMDAVSDRPSSRW